MCLRSAQSHCASIVADSAETTGLKWAALGGNQIKQIVQVVNSSYVTNTSFAFAATGLSATITPTSSSSKILILLSHAMGGKRDADTSAWFRLVNSAGTLNHGFATYVGYNNASTRNWQGGISTSYLHSPNTTSAITYSTEFQNAQNTGTVLSGLEGDSVIQLIEIGGL